MNLNSNEDRGLALFLQQKERYRIYSRNQSISERLRQLESLQEQSYEIMALREANGGVPVSNGWKIWAKAQEELKK